MHFSFRIPILRAMYDGQDDDFIAILKYFVDDDVRPFEKLPGAFDETRPPHVREFGKLQPHYLRLDAGDQIMRGTGTIFSNPLKDVVQLSPRSRIECYLMCRMCGNA
jgi:hypothetical protein